MKNENKLTWVVDIGKHIKLWLMGGKTIARTTPHYFWNIPNDILSCIRYMYILIKSYTNATVINKMCRYEFRYDFVLDKCVTPTGKWLYSAMFKGRMYVHKL